MDVEGGRDAQLPLADDHDIGLVSEFSELLHAVESGREDIRDVKSELATFEASVYSELGVLGADFAGAVQDKLRERLAPMEKRLEEMEQRLAIKMVRLERLQERLLAVQMPKMRRIITASSSLSHLQTQPTNLHDQSSFHICQSTHHSRSMTLCPGTFFRNKKKSCTSNYH